MNTKSKSKVLVIEGKTKIRECVKAYLLNEFQIVETRNARDGINLAIDENPDVILLDLHLIDECGFNICETLRSGDLTKHIPILILSPVEDQESRIRAFNVGADDFILKPLAQEELAARVRSKMRRKQETRSNEKSLISGDIRVNFDNHQVEVAGKNAILTMLELRLLRYLIENKEKVISRESFLKAIWTGTKVSTRTVDTHISSLRKKLAGSDHEIVMMYGAGYQIRPSEVANA